MTRQAGENSIDKPEGTSGSVSTNTIEESNSLQPSDLGDAAPPVGTNEPVEHEESFTTSTMEGESTNSVEFQSANVPHTAPAAGPSHQPVGMAPGSSSVPTGTSAPPRGEDSCASSLALTGDDLEDLSQVIDPDNPQFPSPVLDKLEEMVNRPRWVVPVLDDGELQQLLRAAIALCKLGVDTKSEACQRFFSGGLMESFNKILNDEAVNGWKADIQVCIFNNCKLLIDLCVLKVPHDWFPLLELLSMVLNPNCRFHSFNCTKPPETSAEYEKEGREVYARIPEGRQIPNRGWLVDLVNRFGSQGGFEAIQERFAGGQTLSLSVIAALIKPFGLCYEVLHPSTVKQYFIPLVGTVPEFMKGLSDEELRKEAKTDNKTEAKNDILPATIKALKSLATRVDGMEESVKALEMFRLEMILKLLKISSFNGKMNALNEVNKVLSLVTFPQRSGTWEAEEWLTAPRLVAWIQDSKVLDVVLQGNLHQPQYVEKLEKILRFMIKENGMTLKDLDYLWEAQAGKHQAIVKNIHELLAKLAWDFTAEQLDHLFYCFQASWTGSTKKQQEKLLELIRRLAEDDKEGVMATKVLGLLWKLAHAEDCPVDIMEQALGAHLKILDYSCSQDRDQHKMSWIDQFVSELKSNERWIIPALRQIREVCTLFNEAPTNYPQQRSQQVLYRNVVIASMQTNHNIVPMVSERLTEYMHKARMFKEREPDVPAEEVRLDGRFNHIQRVNEPLRFLRFLLKDGHLWLCMNQARELWRCLAVNAAYESDREACFRWFSKVHLMGDEPDLDPVIIREFFETNILQLDPSLLSDYGMACFERFFKYVNLKESKLCLVRKSGGSGGLPASGAGAGAPGGVGGGTVLMEDMDLIGLDYLWKVILHASDSVAEKATTLTKDIYTNLGPRLLPDQVAIHNEFMSDCFERLRASHDTIKVLAPSSSADSESGADSREAEAVRMMRVLTVLKEYVSELDEDYTEERVILPLSRASRGRHISVMVRMSGHNRQMEDFDLISHSNDTFGSVRREILHRMRLPGNSMYRVELYVSGGELLDTAEDRRLISQGLGGGDKLVLTVKLTPNSHSRQDSSSDESASGECSGYGSGPSLDKESKLPGVLLSNNPSLVPYLFQIADTGSQMQLGKLLQSTRNLLNLLPPHTHTKRKLEELCRIQAERGTAAAPQPSLDDIIFGSSMEQASSCKVLYYLELIYISLLPARDIRSDTVQRFQQAFVEAGGVPLVLKILSDEQFMALADNDTKRAAYLCVIKVAKLLLTTVSNAIVNLVAAEQQAHKPITEQRYNHALHLQGALGHMPHPVTENTLRMVASSLATAVGKKAAVGPPDMATIQALQQLAWQASCETPDSRSVSPSSSFNADVSGDNSNLQSMYDEGEPEHVLLVREALEVLSLSLALNPSAMDELQKNKRWHQFIIHLLLICKDRAIRVASVDQFYLIFTRCHPNPSHTVFLVTLLFANLMTDVPQYAEQSYEFFALLCRLLNHMLNCHHERFSVAETKLKNEIEWLKRVREEVLSGGELTVADALLEGHLCVARELVLFMSPQLKFFYGSAENGPGVIREIMEDFIFAASKGMLQTNAGSPRSILDEAGGQSANGGLPNKAPGAAGANEEPGGQTNPVCSSASSLKAAYELLCAFCNGCLPNLSLVADTLTRLYYSNTDAPLVEWEYLPPVGSRPRNGFAGLKNGGATCYMNSVLQQLFMIPPIFEGVLEAVIEPNGDEPSPPVSPNVPALSGQQPADEEGTNEIASDGLLVAPGGGGPMGARSPTQEDKKAYNLSILKQVQIIFAHLAFSKLQYFVPKGFWKHYRYLGEPVNLRDQHDSLEFYNTLIDSLDEAFKSLGLPPHLVQVLGGSYADQKICKGCPHRYCSQQPFTAVNAEIRNHQSLKESLEQFVKGDLLEGANAYHCDKCDRKVDTVKRMVILKLPQILAIQLKRFDYDWERDCAIKFNDYFEFPRELDMAPYTVHGLGQVEGEIITGDDESAKLYENQTTKYRLVGVVVHSGQASSGHYYSYILHRPAAPGSEATPSKTGGQGGQGPPAQPQWYKFDDGDVSECRMEDDEELKNQCFGGEYIGEVFDHMLKRVSFRRQKRWWSAYLLIYEKIDASESERQAEREEAPSADSEPLAEESTSSKEVTSLTSSLTISTVSAKQQLLQVPAAIKQVVRTQNVEFSHNRNQFSPEYFGFMKRLLLCNSSYVQMASAQEKLASPAMDTDKLAMISVQLASKFLFSVGFRTKKSLRGQAQEWFELLSGHLKASAKVRYWFAHNVLFQHPQRFSEYLLECPSSDVRSMFAKLLCFLAHSALADDDNLQATVRYSQQQTQAHTSVSEHILQRVLHLLKRDVSEFGRNVTQYFHFFHMYANMGERERRQLLQLDVPAVFMAVALDEGPGPPIKYQYTELSKLYAVVSLLIRCTDLTPCTRSAQQGGKTLANPFVYEDVLFELSNETSAQLLTRPSFVKKIIEDNNINDESVRKDTTKLLCYVCWENPTFSHTVLGELLWQIAYSYTHELKPHMDLLLQMLLLNDSWQRHRISNTLKGVPEDREGLFDTIQRAKNHYQKRAYQCIKMLVNLFHHCEPAKQILELSKEFRQNWQYAVEWLGDELERRPYSTNQQYAYSNWSPPAQSNETSNGYFLQRSNSAKVTLDKATQLLPVESDDVDMADEQDDSADESCSPVTTPGVGVQGARTAYGTAGGVTTATRSATSGVGVLTSGSPSGTKSRGGGTQGESSTTNAGVNTNANSNTGSSGEIVTTGVSSGVGRGRLPQTKGVPAGSHDTSGPSTSGVGGGHSTGSRTVTGGLGGGMKSSSFTPGTFPPGHCSEDEVDSGPAVHKRSGGGRGVSSPVPGEEAVEGVLPGDTTWSGSSPPRSSPTVSPVKGEEEEEGRPAR